MPELSDREKVGFSAPLDSWLREGLRPWAEHLLESSRLEANGFRAALVREKWREHLSGTRNWQFALWSVLMWQAFFDETRHVMTGEVRLKLYRGSYSVLGRRSPYSLYDGSLANQKNLEWFDNLWAEGFTSLWTLPTRHAARRQRPVEPPPASEGWPGP